MRLDGPTAGLQGMVQLLYWYRLERVGMTTAFTARCEERAQYLELLIFFDRAVLFLAAAALPPSELRHKHRLHTSWQVYQARHPGACQGFKADTFQVTATSTAACEWHRPHSHNPEQQQAREGSHLCQTLLACKPRICRLQCLLSRRFCRTQGMQTCTRRGVGWGGMVGPVTHNIEHCHRLFRYAC